jgi:hypothetical protein
MSGELVESHHSWYVRSSHRGTRPRHIFFCAESRGIPLPPRPLDNHLNPERVGFFLTLPFRRRNMSGKYFMLWRHLNHTINRAYNGTHFQPNWRRNRLHLPYCGQRLSNHITQCTCHSPIELLKTLCTKSLIIFEFPEVASSVEEIPTISRPFSEFRISFSKIESFITSNDIFHPWIFSRTESFD